MAAQHYPDASHVDARIGRFEAAYVGHAEEGEFRARGSSGGLVTWVAAELLRRGLVDGVAHVAPVSPEGGAFFRYRISRDPQALTGGSKSRYYPIELSGVLDEMRAVPGRYAVVGIPCFIKAVRLACLADPVLAERVHFTLGLFCGHMKSARLVDSFARQMGTQPAEVTAVDYRRKDAGRPANWYRTQLRLRDGGVAEQDWWHLVEGDWGSGFFQNSACNYCDDVVAETADVSFGDAWVEPYTSDGRGTNVLIARTRLLADMLDEAAGQGRVVLKAVDADFVAGTQAAGLRQRREGLSYRLARRRRSPMPRKRVGPSTAGISVRRKGVYRMRETISAASHRLYALAERLHLYPLYLRTAQALVTGYGALTYSKGRLGTWIDRLEGRLAQKDAGPG